MGKKAPRRTAERILETALTLFNRLGAPNVSTTLIAAELGISPGNLYYHYPAKDELLGALFDQHTQAMERLLQRSVEVRDIEQAQQFVHETLQCIWAYRFLYRDLNDLLSNNRRLEQQIGTLMRSKAAALGAMLAGLRANGALRMDTEQIKGSAARMLVLLTYWLSYEYALAPRDALEPQAEPEVLQRAAQHVLGLLSPYLTSAAHELELSTRVPTTALLPKH